MVVTRERMRHEGEKHFGALLARRLAQQADSHVRIGKWLLVFLFKRRRLCGDAADDERRYAVYACVERCKGTADTITP